MLAKDESQVANGVLRSAPGSTSLVNISVPAILVASMLIFTVMATWKVAGFMNDQDRRLTAIEQRLGHIEKRLGIDDQGNPFKAAITEPRRKKRRRG